MPRVWCASVECANNENNRCTAKEINLSDGHIHTVHQGYKQMWLCQTYNMSSRAKEIKAKLDALKGE